MQKDFHWKSNLFTSTSDETQTKPFYICLFGHRGTETVHERGQCWPVAAPSELLYSSSRGNSLTRDSSNKSQNKNIIKLSQSFFKKLMHWHYLMWVLKIICILSLIHVFFFFPQGHAFYNDRQWEESNQNQKYGEPWSSYVVNTSSFSFILSCCRFLHLVTVTGPPPRPFYLSCYSDV